MRFMIDTDMIYNRLAIASDADHQENTYGNWPDEILPGNEWKLNGIADVSRMVSGEVRMPDYDLSSPSSLPSSHHKTLTGFFGRTGDFYHAIFGIEFNEDSKNTRRDIVRKVRREYGKNFESISGNEAAIHCHGSQIMTLENSTDSDYMFIKFGRGDSIQGGFLSPSFFREDIKQMEKLINRVCYPEDDITRGPILFWRPYKNQ